MDPEGPRTGLGPGNKIERQIFKMSETPNFDTVTAMLAEQVTNGISAIEAANETLLESEKGTGDREIDKAFKDEKVEDSDAVKAWAKAEKARETYKKALAEARNLYRENVLGEEAKPESDVDVEHVKEIRSVVMNSLALIQTLAKSQSNSSVLTWAESIQVPQVGRKGVSSVGGSGSKKPRAYVSFDGTTYDSFSQAAKAVSAALSDDENKVTVTSPDLVQAWEDQGSGDLFEFQGYDVKVALKNAS